MAFLDPCLISNMDKNKTRLKSLLRQLVQCNRIAESEVDEILCQHSDYAVSMLDRKRDRFMNFDPLKSRLDILMHEHMSGNLHTASCGTLSECCWFFHIVKQLLKEAFQ